MPFDTGAFETKYGPGLPIAGQYQGSLDNSGEALQLLDAAGAQILGFEFNNGWYTQTDGEGYSLTPLDVFNTPVANYSTKTAWQAGTKLNGTPGVLP